MTVFHSPSRLDELCSLFGKAFGVAPPFGTGTAWQDCFRGDLSPFFEPNLPSPALYREWLRAHLRERQFIPYVLESDDGKKNLEGATNVDALLMNETNGFAVVIEAKVLSDISCQITYDVMRSQIARNIDVMLDSNPGLCPPLDKRDPEKTLFLLLTPRIFKDNPRSHLYGYNFNEYWSEPSTLGRDLPHRKDCDWEAVSRRLGWLTWEDFREVNPECCIWLKQVKGG